MKRLIAVLASTLLLAGCVQKPHVDELALDGTLAPFYAQKLVWESCGNLECSSFFVPLNYDDLSGQTIQIHINRHVATSSSQRQGSIVVNPGGPGGSGLDYLEAYEQIFTPKLMAHFDMVGFDPRGVGESAPIECTSAKEKDKNYASDPTPDTPAEIKEYQTPWNVSNCEKRLGDLLGHVSTVETVSDIDILRALLGEKKLNYLGKSYGTQIGAVYATLFPENVGRFVLDGAVDMKMSSPELTLGQAAGFEGEFRRFARYCSEYTAKCPLGKTEDQVLSGLVAFLAQLDQKPLKTKDSKRNLTEGHVWNALFGSMYSPQWTWDWLIESLSAGYKGDGTALLEMSDWNASRNPDGTYADNSFDAYPAINCLDYPYKPVDQKKFYAAAVAAAPIVGAAFGWMEGGCEGWPVSGIPMPHDLSTAASVADQILVVGTTYDPATPVQWARNLAQQLGGATYIEFNGDGHTAYFNGSSCLDKKIDSFYIKGTVPTNEPICQPDEPILG